MGEFTVALNLVLEWMLPHVGVHSSTKFSVYTRTRVSNTAVTCPTADQFSAHLINS